MVMKVVRFSYHNEARFVYFAFVLKGCIRIARDIVVKAVTN